MPIPRSAREKPLVLVVDDEAQAQELLVNYLTGDGYDVATASGGKEAVEKAEELAPDAITLNMLAPGKGGWQALAELKQSPTTAGIPIVIVSVVDQRRMGFALGAAEYLVKPVSRQSVLQAIQRHVHRTNGPPTVLIVDDEPEAVQMMTEVLASAGYDPVAAGGGREALEILMRQRPAAILLDLMMPDIDGFELMRRIKENPDLREIPVFVLTAKELSDAEMDLLAKETRAFFLKHRPWQEELLTQVRRVIRSSARGACA